MIVLSIFTFVFLVLFLLLLSMGGSLMPVWIFMTSLSLLAHTQLFNFHLPQECLIIMKVMLKFMRLDLTPVEDDPLETLSEDSPPPYMFQIAGYQSSNFITNMSYPILFALVAPLPLLVLTALKDLLCEICYCFSKAKEGEIEMKPTLCR